MWERESVCVCVCVLQVKLLHTNIVTFVFLHSIFWTVQTCKKNLMIIPQECTVHAAHVHRNADFACVPAWGTYMYVCICMYVCMQDSCTQTLILHVYQDEWHGSNFACVRLYMCMHTDADFACMPGCVTWFCVMVPQRAIENLPTLPGNLYVCT